jgi:hypothetical protein
MDIFNIIGKATICILVIYLFRLIWIKIRPINESRCTKDHDTMARYGAKKCDMCETKLNDY